MVPETGLVKVLDLDQEMDRELVASWDLKTVPKTELVSALRLGRSWSLVGWNFQ